MTKELFNFDYNINIDVLWLVKEMYPGLNDNDIQTIAAEIVETFDYSYLCDDLHQQLQDAVSYTHLTLPTIYSV